LSDQLASSRTEWISRSQKTQPNGMCTAADLT
jgi:hypothetical protein